MTAAYQIAQQWTSYSNSLEAPSDETTSAMMSLFRKLAAVDREADGEFARPMDVDEQLVLRTLREISDSEDVLQVVDVDKYNLLQKAIIWNKIEIVKALIDRGGGCNDSNVCDGSYATVDGEAVPDDVNRPLHLACFLGNLDHLV